MEQGGDPGLCRPKVREVYHTGCRCVVRAGAVWKVGGSKRKREAGAHGQKKSFNYNSYWIIQLISNKLSYILS